MKIYVLLIATFISIFSHVTSAQVDEIVITGTSYIIPSDYSKWAADNQQSTGGLGAAAAGAAYSAYREKIAKQNACLDKKNAIKAAEGEKVKCIEQQPVFEAIANNSCPSQTERSITVNLGPLSTGVDKSNPRQVCLDKNHNDRIIAEYGCTLAYNKKIETINSNYQTLKCSN